MSKITYNAENYDKRDRKALDKLIKENNTYITLPKSRKIALVTCHKIPSRSFHWKGKPLICYRCLGIDLGIILFFLLFIVGIFYQPFSPIGWLVTLAGSRIWLMAVLIILSQVPFALDGSVQAMWSRYESKNVIRFVTGIIGGVGQFYLFSTIFLFILVFIKWIIGLF